MLGEGSMSGPALALLFLWVVLVQDSIRLRTALPLYWQVHGLVWELLQLQPRISPLSFGTPTGNERALAECLRARQEFALPW